jgi:hypothetical protein
LSLGGKDMKKGFIGSIVVFFLLSLMVPSFCEAKIKLNKQELLKILDPIVDKTLAAYNLNDDVKFYEYYAQEMHDVTTAKDFKAYFVDIHKRNLGDYITRVLVENKCSFDEFYPVVVYKGEFKKKKNINISVYFVNEHGFYRITRVEFDRNYFEE